MKNLLIRRAVHLLAAIILFAPFSGLALNLKIRHPFVWEHEIEGPFPGLPLHLEIRTAVELEFPTEKGAGYQLLVSPDLQTWEPSGRQIIGTGEPVRFLTSARKDARFHRLESFPGRDLNPLIDRIRAERGVPAMACALILSNRIAGIGASGDRRFGTNAPVMLQDRWHLGSVTKSMTATLAAMLVEEGTIQWTNTLADIFPEQAPSMHAWWREATLEQFTSNRGGAPEDSSLLWSLQTFGGSPRDARRRALTQLTTQAPASKPGTRYEYSNSGFVLAGHMLETIAGKPWEQLIRERIFEPLELKGAGFGAPGVAFYLDQPLGHRLTDPNSPPGPSNRITPLIPGPSADHPPVFAPAGLVHCTIEDLAAYALFHLAVHKRDTPFLTRASGLYLHTAAPNNSDYAHGWFVSPDHPFAEGDALAHTGSNLYWQSVIWLDPESGAGLLGFCNLGGNSSEQAIFALFDELAAEYLAKSE